MFYKAESLRLFKCEAGQVNIIPEIKEILDQPTTVLSSVNDYYSAFMINKRAKHYGVEVENPANTEFFKSLISHLDTSWIDDFNTDTFQLNNAGDKDGVTFDTVKLLEMMSTVQKDKSVGKKA